MSEDGKMSEEEMSQYRLSNTKALLDHQLADSGFILGDLRSMGLSGAALETLKANIVDAIAAPDVTGHNENNWNKQFTIAMPDGTQKTVNIGDGVQEGEGRALRDLAQYQKENPSAELTVDQENHTISFKTPSTPQVAANVERDR